MTLEHQHFNRIKSIIENEENDISHLHSICRLINTFRNNFGLTKLYFTLLKMETILFNYLIKKS